jgi:ATP synthase protein I
MMTDHDEQTNGDMREAVRRREKQSDAWQSTGERPLWRNLSMVGALGWLIVIPTLLGILIGHWLDMRFGTGIFWSGALIMLGTAFGFYLAWQRITKE